VQVHPAFGQGASSLLRSDVSRRARVVRWAGGIPAAGRRCLPGITGSEQYLDVTVESRPEDTRSGPEDLTAAQQQPAPGAPGSNQDSYSVVSYGRFNMVDQSGVLYIASTMTTFRKIAGRAVFWSVLLYAALFGAERWLAVPAGLAAGVSGLVTARLIIHLRRLWRISRIETVSAHQLRVNHQWADPHLVAGVIRAADVLEVRRRVEGDLCCVEVLLQDQRCAQLVSTATPVKSGAKMVDQAVERVAEILKVPVGPVSGG
jgi:hypothetical protein